MAAKNLICERRPLSENFNSYPIYKNPHAGFHEGQLNSSSSPDLSALPVGSNRTSHALVASFSEEETDGQTSSSKNKTMSAKGEQTLLQAQCATVSIHSKRQDQLEEPVPGCGNDGKFSPSLETNDSYVECSSKGSPCLRDYKAAANEPAHEQVKLAMDVSQPHLDEHYMIMRSASESSNTKPPNQRESSELSESLTTMNPLYAHTLPRSGTGRAGGIEYEPGTEDVFTSCGEYLVMKSINQES